jgi:hypothetical protein
MNSSERHDTIVCSFDSTSPMITAYQIHEWINDKMHLREEDVRMIQIDGPQRNVYIKFISHDKMMAAFQNISGPLEYKQEDGVLSIVQVEVAGMGIKNVRVANLPQKPQTEFYKKHCRNMGK